MFKSLVGSKVGMTQIFNKEERKVVPVTAVKVEGVFVTQVKTKDRDGYDAVQVGVVRDRYLNQEPSRDWFLKKKHYFRFLKEVVVSEGLADAKLKVGQRISLRDFVVKVGDSIKVVGVSKGLGFQGVMRRHGYSGGPKSHGSNFHRAPGAVGSIRMVGEVFKGKGLPGRTGGKRTSVGSTVERMDLDSGCLFLRGSVPGKKGFFVELIA